jgi:hypothetical protein
MGGVMSGPPIVNVSEIQPITRDSHRQLTALVVHFAGSPSLKPTAGEARDRSEYGLEDQSGVAFNTSPTIALKSAVYNSRANTVRLNLKKPFRLSSTSILTLVVDYADDGGEADVPNPRAPAKGDAVDALLERGAMDSGKGLFRR